MKNGNGKKNVESNGSSNGQIHYNDRGERVCYGLNKRCRECNYKFTAEDTAADVTLCPNCSTPRGHCQLTTLQPNGRCVRHGGASLSGIAHPRYKGRGYSRYLPTRLKDDYEAAIGDPDLIELRSEMALNEARMADVLRQLDTGESGQTWRTAQNSMRDLMRALQADPPDAKAQTAALAALRDTIDRGAGDDQLWAELKELIDAKRRLVETELKRAVATRQYLTLEKAGLLFDALAQVVVTHVQDRSTLARIQREWFRLYSGSRVEDISASELDASDDG